MKRALACNCLNFCICTSVLGENSTTLSKGASTEACGSNSGYRHHCWSSAPATKSTRLSGILRLIFFCFFELFYYCFLCSRMSSRLVRRFFLLWFFLHILTVGGVPLTPTSQKFAPAMRLTRKPEPEPEPGPEAVQPEPKTETLTEDKKIQCPDDRVCEVTYEWSDPCEVFFCDNYCDWGADHCPGEDEPPRPDCEVLTCTSSNSTPPTPPPPGPTPPPSPTPPPPPTPPTPGPMPPPTPTPPKSPAWKLPILIVGGIALSILVPGLAVYGFREAREKYAAYKLRERRNIAEHVRLEDRLDQQRFQEEFNRAMVGYIPLDNSPHPDSIEVHMQQEEEADRLREEEEQERKNRRLMELEAAETYRRMHGHEDEPLIRVNVRGGAVRMSRMLSDLKEKGSKVGETASASARNLRDKIQNRRGHM